MAEFAQNCFAWPSLPATVLLLAVCGYWLLVIAGAADVNFLDTELEVDLEASHGSILDLGFVPLRFLNLGTVPLMIWVSVFALAFWGTTRVIDGAAVYTQTADILQAVFRNAGIAVLATKLLTQPLRGRFLQQEPNTAEQLIGRTCVISAAEGAGPLGQAECPTGGAPLQLTVRSVDGVLTKGAAMQIVDFLPAENVYLVKRSSPEM